MGAHGPNVEELGDFGASSTLVSDSMFCLYLDSRFFLTLAQELGFPPTTVDASESKKGIRQQ